MTAMDPLHAILHKASRDVRLDPQVRDGFRRTLVLMADGPAPAPAFRLNRALAWSLGALVLAASGTTVTLASTRALPGEALYAAKVDVLEPVERAFAFSAEAQGEVAVRHLERRFREAAELSAAGTYAEHDDELAALAEADVRLLDDERRAASRARFAALAAAYGPTLALDASGRVAFRNATRLGRIGDDVPDEVASAAARSQLTLAKENRDSASSAGAARTAAAARRIEESDRLSVAAEAELGKGAYRAALELSGAAAKAATEARLFAAIASSTASSTDEAASTTSSTTATTSAAASTTAPRGPLDGLFR